MDIVKRKWKRNFVLKVWERCRSLGGGSDQRKRIALITKSKSWHSSTKPPLLPANVGDGSRKKGKVAPVGCFYVYVGQQRQRFVKKTKFVNHLLFKKLLEDVELKYGFNSEGPICLPCEVDLFYKVLAEIDGEEEKEEDTSPTCVFVGKGYYNSLDNGYCAYRLLSPSRSILRINRF
ncbi:Auxin-responsive protein [Quillaja saponaria]|uniref:Auxin-responsive protein n=1 Tax=Quillaja saponaria TaxID=32244 RepID=A0AAD7PJN1_QUISA|nr:Auxin-responsive protein [Quillaja saponaria]